MVKQLYDKDGSVSAYVQDRNGIVAAKFQDAAGQANDRYMSRDGKAIYKLGDDGDFEKVRDAHQDRGGRNGLQRLWDKVRNIGYHPAPALGPEGYQETPPKPVDYSENAPGRKSGRTETYKPGGLLGEIFGTREHHTESRTFDQQVLDGDVRAATPQDDRKMKLGAAERALRDNDPSNDVKAHKLIASVQETKPQHDVADHLNNAIGKAPKGVGRTLDRLFDREQSDKDTANETKRAAAEIKAMLNDGDRRGANDHLALQRLGVDVKQVISVEGKALRDLNRELDKVISGKSDNLEQAARKATEIGAEQKSGSKGHTH